MGTFRRGESMRLTTWWKGLPSVARWLLVTITLMAVTGGSVLAYRALEGQGEVTVIENLSWVGENTFAVNVYPQESVMETLTLANASSVEMEVDIVSTIDPDPGAKGMDIDIPAKVTIPAIGQQSFDVTITAGKSAEPITYTVTFYIER